VPGQSQAINPTEAESQPQTQISRWGMQEAFDVALGQGRVDPFNTYPIRGVPWYVHEILDHGELSFRIPASGGGPNDQQKRPTNASMRDPNTPVELFIPYSQIADKAIPALNLTWPGVCPAMAPPGRNPVSCAWLQCAMSPIRTQPWALLRRALRSPVGASEWYIGAAWGHGASKRPSLIRSISACLTTCISHQLLPLRFRTSLSSSAKVSD
jgi:hypothetical protein